MQNFNPIYGLKYRNAYVILLTGANTYTGADATLLFTADALEGSKLVRLIATPRGTNAQCVLRTFISLDAGTTRRALPEMFMAATTASAVIQAIPLIMPHNLGLQADAQIYVQLSATVVGGWDIVAEAMDY